MGFRLTIEHGQGQGQAFDFDDEVTLGRADSNDVVLEESGVSRHHASIFVDQGRWAIRDEGTANGTLLNGSRVESEYLEDGDTITIGSVMFRYGGLGTGAAVASSDEDILAVPADSEGTRPGIQMGTNPNIASPFADKPGLSAPVKKALAGVVALIVLAALGLGVMRSMPTGPVAEKCPEIPMKEGLHEYSFGQGVDADCQAGKKLAFSMTHVAKSRAILSYSPFYTEQGELGLYVNDVKVADVPAVRSQRAIAQEYTIPDRALVEGEKNLIEFRFEGQGDGVWGIRAVHLEVIGLNEADIEKAKQAYELGKRRYREKNIAAPNLFKAWEHLREARRYMEGLDPKPSDYQPVIDLTRDVEKELDKLCRERLFAAKIEAKYNQYDAANDIYKFILLAFPDDRHECRRLATENMWDDG